MSNERNLSIGVELTDFTAREQQAVALKALRGVILGTPVDKGRARGNWQMSINAPKTDQLNVFDKSGGEAINSGVKVILSASEINLPDFWISNNLPYIVPLNNGSSKQAPKFFVERAIEIAAK